MKIILDLCGGTGAWSKPYADAGYDVRVITLPDDARLVKMPSEPIHGVLAAPPCTLFCTGGSHLWHKRSKEELIDALSIVDACIRIAVMTMPVFWVLENPPGRLNKYLGTPTYKFQPYEFGDGYSKLTYLWGRFNPPEKNNKVPFKTNVIENMTGDRVANRSITPPGFAKAFFKANR